ncbi:hypothetical protein FQA39_LY02611 [Lamprigera yunnana]|nr:hypothetical protein FQA39_LY02611 [Lamprigera yunnana]
MCKSSGGGCFSELLDQVNQGDYKGIHGCLELLNDRNHRKWCENGSNSSPRTPHRKKIHSKSMVICCYQDMCNHADSPETKILLNDTVLGTDLNENDTRPIENVGAKQDPALYTDSEVWFRAATIAVPICGAVILLALILLAVKLLRTDSSSYQNRNRKLGILSHSYSISSDQKHCEKQSTYHHRNIIHPELFLEGSLGNPVYLKETEDFRQKYVPLLIQDDIRNIEKNCDKKNETNAKLNFMQEFEQCTVTNCDDSVVSEHLLHKKTDIHVGRNTAQENNIDNSRETINKMYNKECIP